MKEILSSFLVISIVVACGIFSTVKYKENTKIKSIDQEKFQKLEHLRKLNKKELKQLKKVIKQKSIKNVENNKESNKENNDEKFQEVLKMYEMLMDEE